VNEERRVTDPFKDDIHQLIEHVGAMRTSLAVIEQQMLAQMIKVEDHHKTLYGVNGTPGLTISVDRLNQAERIRERHLGVIYTAIAGLSIKEFWSLFMGNKGP